MEGADRNVEEQLDELARVFRATRQSTITTELIDTVVGLRSDPNRRREANPEVFSQKD